MSFSWHASDTPDQWSEHAMSCPGSAPRYTSCVSNVTPFPVMYRPNDVPWNAPWNTLCAFVKFQLVALTKGSIVTGGHKRFSIASLLLVSSTHLSATGLLSFFTDFLAFPCFSQNQVLSILLYPPKGLSGQSRCFVPINCLKEPRTVTITQ